MKTMIDQTKLAKRVAAIRSGYDLQFYRATDTAFSYFLTVMYLLCIGWAFFTSPLTYVGSRAYVHPHLWTAILLGGLLTIPTVLLNNFQKGEAISRWTVSVTAPLMCGLLIHVSGGRLESHFSIFVCLPFLAFYRDWRLLIPATLVTALDHLFRGVFLPMSIYGTTTGATWRFVEHSFWVVFEDVILIASSFRSAKLMGELTLNQAMVELTMGEVEMLAEARLCQLDTLERRSSAVINSALDGLISFNGNGLITEVNPAAIQMMGEELRGAVGQPLTAWLRVERRGNTETPREGDYLVYLRSVLNQHLETAAVRVSGEEFPVELTVVSTGEGDDGEENFTAFIRDLSHRKRLEADLAQAQKLESIGQLAAGVAHEINTPNQYIGDNITFLKSSYDTLLEMIDLYSRALSTESDPPITLAQIKQKAYELDLEFVLEETPKALAQAQEGTDRVSQIVKAMKEFSHPGQDEHTLMDVNQIIFSTATVTRNEWKYVSQLEMELDPQLPKVNGHPGTIGQVVLNLIINAVHTINDRYEGRCEGLITIKTRVDGDSIEISVTDNGCGIPEHARAHIFEPFYTTKRVGVGTGQGLAISHAAITVKHKGAISFATEINVGTTFFIRLPLQQTQEKAA